MRTVVHFDCFAIHMIGHSEDIASTSSTKPKLAMGGLVETDKSDYM
jgi:hypothetical protein